MKNFHVFLFLALLTACSAPAPVATLPSPPALTATVAATVTPEPTKMPKDASIVFLEGEEFRAMRQAFNGGEATNYEAGNLIEGIRGYETGFVPLAFSRMLVNGVDDGRVLGTGVMPDGREAYVIFDETEKVWHRLAEFTDPENPQFMNWGLWMGADGKGPVSFSDAAVPEQIFGSEIDPVTGEVKELIYFDKQENSHEIMSEGSGKRAMPKETETWYEAALELVEVGEGNWKYSEDGRLQIMKGPYRYEWNEEAKSWVGSMIEVHDFTPETAPTEFEYIGLTWIKEGERWVAYENGEKSQRMEGVTFGFEEILDGAIQNLPMFRYEFAKDMELLLTPRAGFLIEMSETGMTPAETRDKFVELIQVNLLNPEAKKALQQGAPIRLILGGYEDASKIIPGGRISTGGVKPVQVKTPSGDILEMYTFAPNELTNALIIGAYVGKDGTVSCGNFYYQTVFDKLVESRLEGEHAEDFGTFNNVIKAPMIASRFYFTMTESKPDNTAYTKIFELVDQRFAPIWGDEKE